MNEKLKQYIERNLVIEKKSKITNMFRCAKIKDMLYDSDECLQENIIGYIDNNINNNLFQTLLFKYIDDRNLKDSDVYNKVHIDRRLFFKIRSDNNYLPSKDTIFF